MQQTRQEGPDYHCQMPQTPVSLQHDKANACSHEGNGHPCLSCKGGRELVQSDLNHISTQCCWYADCQERPAIQGYIRT